MKKNIFLFLLFLNIVAIYAGDVANFVNLGFSMDGSKFAFGIHGVKDKTYQAYAEIYLIDATTNEFLENGIFKTSPTKSTYALDSKTVLLDLQHRALPYLKKYGIIQEKEGRPLYSQTEQTKDDATLMFRDFETGAEYTVILHSKSVSNLESSFHITCDVLNTNGNKRSYKVGHPDIIRKGTKSYSVKKVIIDNSNTTLVFIIEKKEHEKGGDSVRYMAEVIRS
ncbi:MAG: DUF2259 domain-containing protein [Treponema sp.]